VNREKILQILKDVEAGLTQPEAAARLFEDLHTDDLGYASVDHHRSVRIGFPEVVFGEGKTSDQIVGIVKSLMTRQDRVLVTRVDELKAAAVLKELPMLEHNSVARTVFWKKEEIRPGGRGTVLVVAAGTSDLPVAEEAKVTAEALGNQTDSLYDVGIAGMHRLLEHRGRLRDASVIVVVAGMEGALPSVVGGLIDRPIIAVPTSVGYGASFGGLAALLGMLSSCAPGVVVVNIDNGFGAAYAATMINRVPEPGIDAAPD
jgi:hypothetical protein